MDIDEQPGPSAAEKGKAVANSSNVPAAAPSKGYELPWVGMQDIPAKARSLHCLSIHASQISHDLPKAFDDCNTN